jgi:hypothetical protein
MSGDKTWERAFNAAIKYRFTTAALLSRSRRAIEIAVCALHPGASRHDAFETILIRAALANP